MKKNNLFKIIVAIITLGVVGYLIYKTYLLKSFGNAEYIEYKNDYYGYSINYPNDWELIYHPTEDPSTTPFIQFEAPRNEHSNILAMISVHAQNCVSEIVCQPVDPEMRYRSTSTIKSSSISNAAEISIGNEKAYAFSVSENPIMEMGDGTFIYNTYNFVLNDGDISYNIRYFEGGDSIKTSDDWIYEKVAEKIVNSFQII